MDLDSLWPGDATETTAADQEPYFLLTTPSPADVAAPSETATASVADVATTSAPVVSDGADVAAPSETATTVQLQSLLTIPASVAVVSDGAATPPSLATTSQCTEGAPAVVSVADVATTSPSSSSSSSSSPPQLNNVGGRATLMQLMAFLNCLIPLCQGDSSLSVFLRCVHSLLVQHPPPSSLSATNIIREMTAAYLTLVSGQTSSSSSSSSSASSSSSSSSLQLGGRIQEPVAAVEDTVSVVTPARTESSGANGTVLSNWSQIQEPLHTVSVVTPARTESSGANGTVMTNRSQIQEPLQASVSVATTSSVANDMETRQRQEPSHWGYTRPKPMTSWYTCKVCRYETARATDMDRHMTRADHSDWSFSTTVVCDRKSKPRPGANKKKESAMLAKRKKKRRS